MSAIIDSTKGIAITVLSQGAQHEASAPAKSSELAEVAFALNAPTVNHNPAVIKRMEYLDLAVDFKLANTKSANKVSSDVPFVKIPFGEKTIFNRALLKAMGPAEALYFFPSLPVEIRRKIIGYAMDDVEGVTIQVKVTDNGRTWVGQAYPPPELVAASKEAAVRYMNETKRYVQLFKNGTTLYDGNLDEITVTLISAVKAPRLTIGPKFAVSMANISSLTFEVCNIENSVQWIKANLQGMVSLKSLAIHAFIPISAPGQSEVTFYIVSKDLDGTREEYSHVLESEGATFVGFHAMPEIDRRIAIQNERQGIIDLWMMLNRCLKNRTNFPTFPSTVLTGLHWVNNK